MKIPGADSTINLTYCLNVHAAESWAETFEAIRRFPVAVKARIAPSKAFGLGLRLSNRAAVELLQQPGRLDEFKRFLWANDFYVFTVNAFPYGKFHGTPVKDEVYQPDWSDPERREYTVRIAMILAELLPADCHGSISTVPLAYRPREHGRAAVKIMLRHLAETAVKLAGLADKNGREICLGLEPEPDCLLETTAQAVEFFEQRLLPEAGPIVAGLRGCSAGNAERILRRHIGICCDTCHLALQFENPSDSLEALSSAGIRVAKLQLSAALKTSFTPAAAAVLETFCDPVYLHQVKARTCDGRMFSRGDLTVALRSTRETVTAGEEWRIHFHVPLHFTGIPPIESTSSGLDDRFFDTVFRLKPTHLEIETYTFDVLPASLRRQGIVQSIADEYAWVCRRIPG